MAAFPVSRSAQALGEWRAYAGDVRATKYSPLDRITRDNLGRLRIVWRQSAVPTESREGLARRQRSE